MNLSSVDFGAQVIDCSSEVFTCEARNTLSDDLSSIWLSDGAPPQWICISLVGPNSRSRHNHLFTSMDDDTDTDRVNLPGEDADSSVSLSSSLPAIRSIGWQCWHSYSTNPRTVKIHVSSDGKKFRVWDTFEATSQRKGKQIFCCAPIIVSIYPFVVLEVVRTFGGAQTYMNRVFLCTEEEIAPSSESSSDQRGREAKDSDRDRGSDRDRISTPQPDSLHPSGSHQKTGPSPTLSQSTSSQAHSNHSAPVVSEKATSPTYPLSVVKDHDDGGGDVCEDEDLDVLTSSLSSLALGDVSFDMADMLSSYVQVHFPAPPHPQPPQPQSASSALLSSSNEIGQVNPLQDRLHQLEATVLVMNQTLHDMQAAFAVGSSKAEDMTSGDREEKLGDSLTEQPVAGTIQSPSDPVVEATTTYTILDRSNPGLPSSSPPTDWQKGLPPSVDETMDGVASPGVAGRVGHPPHSDPTVPSPPHPTVLTEEPPLLRSRLATLEQQLARLTSLLSAGESSPSPHTSLSIARGVTFISQETQTAMVASPPHHSPLTALSAATAVRSSSSPARSDRVDGGNAFSNAKSSSSSSSSASASASLLSSSSSSSPSSPPPSSSSSSSSRKEVLRPLSRSRHSSVPVPSQTTLHLPARSRQSESILHPSSSSSFSPSSSSSSFVEYLRARDRQQVARDSTVSSEDELQGLEHSIFDLLRLKYRDRIGEEASDRRFLLLDRHAHRSRSQDREGCHHRPPSFDPAPAFASLSRQDRESRQVRRERNGVVDTTKREEGIEVRALIQQLHAKVMRKLIKKAQLEALQIKQESTNLT